MAYKRTIFTVFASLNDVILRKNAQPVSGLPYSEFIINSFKCVESFILRADWSDSTSTKFICSNMYKTDSDLCLLWKLKFGKDKASSTFRVQRSNVSDLLETMLGSATDIETAFLSADVEAVGTIVEKTHTFDNGDIKLTDILPSDYVLCMLDKGVINTSYELKDCMTELALVSAFSKLNLKSCLSKVDGGKLYYVCSLLQQPLTLKSSINKDKLSVLCALRDCENEVNGTAPILATSEYVNSYADSTLAEQVDYKKLYEETLIELNNLRVEHEELLLEDGVGVVDSTDSDSYISVGDFTVPLALVDALEDIEPITGDIDFGSLSEEAITKLRETLLLLMRYDIGTIASDVKTYDAYPLSVLKKLIYEADNPRSAELLTTITKIADFVLQGDSYFNGLKKLSAEIVSAYKESKS